MPSAFLLLNLSQNSVFTNWVLDNVYHQGETPEHIVQMYPTLTLDQVYLAIGYYLRHRDAVDAYIGRMDEEAERIQQEIEAQYPPKFTRADLLKRLQTKPDDAE